MLTTAYLKGPQFDISIKLLVDIGSTYDFWKEKVRAKQALLLGGEGNG